MGLRINTNVSALRALRNLDGTQSGMTTTIGRLSSGMRINTAADDPAGLIISEGMRSQLRGLAQAVRNSQDAVNMSKTAEAALDEVQRLLRDIRALAVHSANTAVVDAPTLQANQTQIRSTIQSINRIAEQTQFGNKKLLDGSAGVMANVTAVDDISSIYMGGTFAGESIQSGSITMARVTQATRASVSLANTFATANTIVTATGSFVINGYSFTSNGTETVQTLVSKINAMAATTGVSAQISGAGPVSIVLNQNTYGSQHSINYFDPSGILHTSASASSTGVDAVYNVTVTTSAGVTTVPFTGGRGPRESGLRLTDSYGNAIMLSEDGNSTLTGTATVVGQITAGSVQFQIGANTGQSVQFALPVVFADRLGTNAVGGLTLADLDVTTQQGAQNAMRIIDDAIQQLAQMRGELGSFQTNFLDSTVRSLTIAQENLTATESQIRDADMAMEITEFTRLQILNQSGMAVLAQANQIPQGVLQLLQG
ncbi:MAG TPA: flagellin [Fimbriimonadaceae bacterium]|nr:flagellin [Fimbriimonadaceae bacterium]